jgi:hypothetical protein
VTVGRLKIVFDGTNLWPPCTTQSVAVVRARRAHPGTLTGNGPSGPVDLAFDGQRIVVTTGNSVSPGGSELLAAGIGGMGRSRAACSDGILLGHPQPNWLARF